MAEAGAVAWQFQRKGYIGIAPDGLEEDEVFEAAVEGGAEDVTFSEELIEVYADPSNLQDVREALVSASIQFETAELTMIPNMTIHLEDKQTLQVMGVIDALEELDDVQQVHSNLQISDETMAMYEAAR